MSEQASIARKLNIKDNTISSQQFNSKNTILTNVKTDTPFYLRGYKAIEEEIQLIKNRKDKTLFIGDLQKLTKEKRNIEQDKTLIAVYGNTTEEAAKAKNLRIDIKAPTEVSPSMAMAIDKYIKG